MNKDQLKGTVKDVIGKTQEKAGRETGDRDTESRGLGNQTEGKAQKIVGDVKDVVHNLKK